MIFNDKISEMRISTEQREKNNASEFYNVMWNRWRCDKAFLGYHHVYIDIIGDKRDVPFNLLEIGILRGHSLMFWAEWLKKGTVCGVDNNKQYEEFHHEMLKNKNLFHIEDNANERIRLWYYDSTNRMDVQRYHTTGKSTIKHYQCIIDDGDHNPYAQIATLETHFSLVAPGGSYIIEDIGPDRVTRRAMEDLWDRVMTVCEETDSEVKYFASDKPNTYMLVITKSDIDINIGDGND